MKKFVLLLLFGWLIFSLQPSFSLEAQNQDKIDDIVAKNIQASGGKDKLSKIKNYAFTAMGQRFFLSADGKMKIISGKAPAVSEIILVNKEKVVRNCFNNITEYPLLLKASYEVMAKLRSGFFTLINFKESLAYEGLKKFGARQYHVLKVNQDPLETKFFIDPDTYTLKRLVLKGLHPERVHYEVNHDFGPYQQFDSILLPSSWFLSQVGTRGKHYEISDVKFNLDLPPDFFSSLELNIGQVDIKPGLIKGNIVDFRLARNNRLTIETNITLDCLEQANIPHRSLLILKIADTQLEVKVFPDRPPREELKPGVIFMMPHIENKNLIVYILSSGYDHLAETLQPLLPLELTLKQEKNPDFLL